MEEEQCPKRGPGLAHVRDGGITCHYCDVLMGMTVYDLMRRMGITKPSDPDPPAAKVDVPEDAPDADPAEVGWCHWRKGHWSTAVWYTPNDRRWYCLEHLKRIVEIALWR